MELRSGSSLYAVCRPGPPARLEGYVVGRVPVPGVVDGNMMLFACGNHPIERWDDLVTSFDAKRAARTEVALNVDNQQRFVRVRLPPL